MRKREFLELFLMELRRKALDGMGGRRLTNDELIDRVISDRGQILRYIENGTQFLDAVVAFPAHAERLIGIVLEDPNGRYLMNNGDVLSELVKGFPHHADEFIRKAFADPLSFQQTIQNADDYRDFDRFEGYADPFMQTILTSREEFLKFIHNPYELGHLCFELPRHADALINMVLRDPVLFDACIHDDAGLQHIKTRFPAIPSLQKATFKEARDAVKAEMIEKNTQADEARYSAFFRGQRQLQGLDAAQQDLATRTARGKDLGSPKK